MDKIFKKHELFDVKSKGWLIQNQDKKMNFWCYIIWCPGYLTLLGDGGDMIVKHGDFSTPDNAAAWVRGANLNYFLEKSNFKKEFDPDGTVERLIKNAEEYRTEHEDIEPWQELGKSFFPGVSPGRYYGKKSRDELKERIFNLAKDEPETFLSNVVEINFEYPCHKYSEVSKIRYAAVKAWGRLMADRK